MTEYLLFILLGFEWTCREKFKEITETQEIKTYWNSLLFFCCWLIFFTSLFFLIAQTIQISNGASVRKTKYNYKAKIYLNERNYICYNLKDVLIVVADLKIQGIANSELWLADNL